MIRMPSNLVRALSLAAVFMLGGCYTYTPVTTPRPGTTVRVHVPLTSAISDRNAPETVDVEGTVLSAEGDSLVLATETRKELGTFRVLTAMDTLRVARSGLAGMEEKTFSSAKTYGLSALVVAGVTGLVLAAIDAGGGSKGDGGPGTQPPVSGVRLPPVVFKQILGFIIP